MTFRAFIFTHRIEDERSMGYLRAQGRSLLRTPATPLRVDALEDKVDSGEKAHTIVASGQLSGYAACEMGTHTDRVATTHLTPL